MKAIILAALVVVAKPALAAPNLVANGDFEDGATSWTSDSWTANGVYNQLHSASGATFIVSQCEGSACRLAQGLHTLPGRHYTLSFALAPVPETDTGTTTVSFSGTTVAIIADPAPGWTTHTYDVVASGTTTVLAFATAPAQSGDTPPPSTPPAAVTALDTVVVTPAVPEPTTWALLLAGFGGVGVALRRRDRTAGATRLDASCPRRGR